MSKKKKEEVIISNTPLEPTTIGVIETKENGPVFAIIWIVIFILGIVTLPYLTEFLSEGTIPTFNLKPKDPTNTTPPSVNEVEEVEYHALENNLKIEVEGFQFQNFETTPDELTFQIVNQSGKSNFFVNNNYYVELYTSEKLLLQRFKISKTEILNSSNVAFSLNQTFSSENIAFLTIVKKEEKDYPPVTLTENVTGNPILTCQKGNKTLTYEFQKANEKNSLISIKENETYNESTTENYEIMLQDTTILNEVYNEINGLKSEFTPVRNGFTFTVTIDLKNIQANSLNRYFRDEIYYPKDTEAKTIFFELSSSGYICE